MSEKLCIEFEVINKEKFLAELQKWDSTAANGSIGYRADDYVSKRAALIKFVDAMEAKLRKNDHKSGWRDLPIEALFRLMMLEIDEFKLAIEFLSVKEALNELPDVANFCMMLHDRLGIPTVKGGTSQEEFLRLKL